MLPLVVCQKCEKRQRACAGPCVCTLDCIDIIRHAADGYCPKRKYGDGARPAAYPLPGNCIEPSYNPTTSATSPKHGSCCDPAKK